MWLKLCFLLYGCGVVNAINIEPMDRDRDRVVHELATPPYISWLGMLTSRDSAPDTDKSLTPIILISEALAVGIAKSIADYDPQPDTSKAMFWKVTGEKWFCGVERFILHPDYYRDTPDVLALLYLIPRPNAEWLPITWPRSSMAPTSAKIVGINDEPQYVHQFWENAVINPKRNCSRYYATNWTSSPETSMPAYSCYVVPRFKYLRCTYPYNMALVYESNGEFNLFGVGIRGPGCFSPSRWVHFHPFTSWIQDSSRPYLRTSLSRDMYDYYQDLDQELLSRLYGKKELKWATNVKEKFGEGVCWGNISRGTLMYREKSYYFTATYGSMATYSISVYDSAYRRFECTTLVAYCEKKTATKWWIDRGFKQDDIDFYVRKVPYSINGTYAPKIVFLMDRYRSYHDRRTGNLDFQFEFDIEAELDVQFYGKN